MIRALILNFFLLNLAYSAKCQELTLDSGDVYLLVLLPDSVKSHLKPSDVISQKDVLFEYFIGPGNQIWDGELRNNLNNYYFPDDEIPRSLDVNLYRINRQIDSLISLHNKFRFISIKNRTLRLAGMNYIFLKLNVIYYKLELGKRECDPLEEILTQPSGIVINKIRRCVIDRKIPQLIANKLKDNFESFTNFIQKEMWCYTGLN